MASTQHLCRWETYRGRGRVKGLFTTKYADKRHVSNRILKTFFPILFCFAACLGCGSGEPFDYLPVKGKLTYEDGNPLPVDGIVLEFIALDVEPNEKSYPRPGSSKLNEQGEFACATSYKYGDGLVPGKHKVAIYYATDDQGNLLIPKEYTHITTTPLTVDTAETPFEIKVPKP